MSFNEYFAEWARFLPLDELKKVLPALTSLYDKEHVFPAYNDIFRAFALCPFPRLTTVFLGQDPYPQPSRATGLAFANPPDTPPDKLSPSLKILKNACINTSIPHKSIIFDSSLESWASQGILLLNSSLTVKENAIGSHIDLWKGFISSFLANLSDYTLNVSFVLFGSQAQSFLPFINSTRNLVLQEHHPSWYARTGTPMPFSLFPLLSHLSLYHFGREIQWFQEEGVSYENGKLIIQNS